DAAGALTTGEGRTGSAAGGAGVVGSTGTRAAQVRRHAGRKPRRRGRDAGYVVGRAAGQDASVSTVDTGSRLAEGLVVAGAADRPGGGMGGGRGGRPAGVARVHVTWGAALTQRGAIGQPPVRPGVSSAAAAVGEGRRVRRDAGAADAALRSASFQLPDPAAAG